jgi:hypothetical protein
MQGSRHGEVGWREVEGRIGMRVGMVLGTAKGDHANALIDPTSTWIDAGGSEEQQ